eukprot:gene9650-1854_t
MREEGSVPLLPTKELPIYHTKAFYVCGYFTSLIVLAVSIALYLVVAITGRYVSLTCSLLPIFGPLFIQIFAITFLLFCAFYCFFKACLLDEEKVKMEMENYIKNRPTRVTVSLIRDCFFNSLFFFGFALGSLFVILVFIDFGIFITLFFGSQTMTNGILALPKLEKNVNVFRDSVGTIHIEAQNEHDLYLTQGFVNAQSRLWQLDTQRRIARGTLSEIMGEETLKIDIASRTLGFDRIAKKTFQKLNNETQQILKWYTDGINSLLDSEANTLPLEYKLFFIKPEKWIPEDIIAISKLTAWYLGGNPRSDVERYRLLQKGYSIQQVLDFYPEYQTDYDVTILNKQESNVTINQNEIDQLEKGFRDDSAAYIPKKLTKEELEKKTVYDTLSSNAKTLESISHKLNEPLLNANRASNNWVVAGKYTATGKPLMANDPHLGFTAPAPFMLFHLECPTFKAIGASYPGIPGMAIGRTDKMSWSLTANLPDNGDIYVMQDSADKKSYTYKGVSTPYTITKHTIRISSYTYKTIEVKESTHYGPVINVIDEMKGNETLCLKSVILSDDDKTLETFVSLFKSDSFHSFRSKFDGYVAPSMNVLYANDAGDIGYFAVGKVPVRKTGHSGRFPVKGDGNFDWTQVLTSNQLPSILNPDKGYIVTANNRITSPGYPYPISLEFGAPFRAKRIESLLRSQYLDIGTKMTATHMKNIQQDVASLPWERLKFIIQNMKVLPNPIHETWRKRLLNDWDGIEIIGSELPTIFEAWLIEMGQIVGKDLKYSKNPQIFYNILQNNTNYNCSNLVVKVDSCESFAALAFENTIATLLGNFGKIPQWGVDVHSTVFYNQGVGNTIFSCLVNVESPQPGGTDTVFANEVGQRNIRSGKFNGFWGPSYRQITDLSDLEKSEFILAPGNSGNILSKYYRGSVDIWSKGSFIPMKMKEYEKSEHLLLKNKV